MQGGTPYITQSYYGNRELQIRVDMTLQQYLVFVGKSDAEYLAEVGPEPAS
jgi:hypothetical protein